MKSMIWHRGQKSRSKVTTFGTQNIIFRYSTYVPNIKGLCHKTKKLWSRQAIGLKKSTTGIWPWGQKSPNLVRDTSPSYIPPKYQISNAYVIRQTRDHEMILTLTFRNWRWAKKLWSGQAIGLMKSIIWPWGQRSPNLARNTSSSYINILNTFLKFKVCVSGGIARGMFYNVILKCIVSREVLARDWNFYFDNFNSYFVSMWHNICYSLVCMVSQEV